MSNQPKKYPTARFNQVNAHMAETLKSIGKVDSGDKYEIMILELLRAHGFTASRTGSNDHGVDIIASITIQGIERKFYIQCKFYNRPLGNDPIMQVYTGLHYYGNDGSAVVITNNHFTVDARSFAYKLGVEIISDPELDTYKEVNKTGDMPKYHKKGLFGILLGISTENPDYAAFSAKKQKQIAPDTKEELIKMLDNKFAEAEECTREAAHLQQKAADFSQRAIQLQKEAIIQNLDYI